MLLEHFEPWTALDFWISFFERIGGFQNMAFDEVDISLCIIDWIPMPDPMVPGIFNLHLFTLQKKSTIHW